MEAIPILSLEDFFSDSLMKKSRFISGVGDALRDIGFFSLVHHGISQQLIDDAYQVVEAFFLLPDAQKKKYELPSNHRQRGFTGFQKEHAKNSLIGDLKEFWHQGREGIGDPEEGFFENVWPQEVDGFKEVFCTLFDKLDACSQLLLKACALSLGEPENLMQSMVEGGNSILRLIHYPPIPFDVNPNAIRAAAHEDINFITLLCEATASGLELLTHQGTWLPIHARKGEIVVDSADMLQNLTNGYFRSTTHRVVNPEHSRERRFSMPFFCHSRGKVSLSPLASCLRKTGGIPRFPNLTAGEYLQKRLKEIGLY